MGRARQMFRDRHILRQRSRIRACDLVTQLDPSIQMRKLHAQDRRLQFVEAAVNAELLMVVLDPSAVRAKRTHALRYVSSRGNEHAAVAKGAQVLRREKTEGGSIAERPNANPIDGRADGLCAILDDCEAVPRRNRHNLMHRGRVPVKMHRNDCARSRRDRRLDALRVDVIVFGSMSANTGVAPTIAIASALATNVNGVVMTSSPGPMSRARSAKCRASVPELTPTAWPQPT